MFLTPDGEPFFGGTYFPKHGRHGLPGFLELLPKVASAYREQGDQLAEQNRRLVAALMTLEPGGGAASLPAEAPAIALAGLKRSFDPVHGGFGSAPKFPHPAELDFCLRASATGADQDALTIVRTTLERMADGGIHDQFGGGFCRYSVDAEWTIPHFEKMLYDNGPLLALYADLCPRHRRSPPCGHGTRHRRLAGARNAGRRRSVLLEPRRGQRGARRQVLRVDAGDGARRDDGRRMGGRRTLLRA